MLPFKGLSPAGVTVELFLVHTTETCSFTEETVSESQDFFYGFLKLSLKGKSETIS